jgi:tetratricopeptide (TPR) repeat protein
MKIFGRPVTFKTVSIAVGFAGTVIGVIIGAYKIVHDLSEARQTREEIRVQISIGDEFLKRQEYKKAILEYEKAIEVDKDDIESNLRLIKAVRSKLQVQAYGSVSGDVDKTLARIYRLRGLEPSFIDNRDLMVEEALVFKADMRFSSAIEVLETARALHPDDNAILAELGYLRALTSRGEKIDGLDLLRKAVEEAPEEARYHYYLADSAKRAKLLGEAIREYIKTARLSTSQDAWNRGVHIWALDEVYSIFNRMGEKEEGLDRVLSREVDMPLEERAQALEYYIDVREPDGKTSKGNPYLYLARIYYELGEVDRATDTVRAALPDNKEEWKNYGAVLRALASILEGEGSDPETLVEVNAILDAGAKNYITSSSRDYDIFGFISFPGYLK